MLINLCWPLRTLTSAITSCPRVQGSTVAAEYPFSLVVQILEEQILRAISGSDQLYGCFYCENPCFCWIAHFCFCSVPQVPCKTNRKRPKDWTESLKLPSTCKILQHLYFSWLKPHQYYRICCWNWLKSTADVDRPELQITLPDRHVGSAFWQQCRKTVIIFVIKRNADGI